MYSFLIIIYCLVALYFFCTFIDSPWNSFLFPIIGIFWVDLYPDLAWLVDGYFSYPCYFEIIFIFPKWKFEILVYFDNDVAFYCIIIIYLILSLQIIFKWPFTIVTTPAGFWSFTHEYFTFFLCFCAISYIFF